jgi:hypothetical protein
MLRINFMFMRGEIQIKNTWNILFAGTTTRKAMVRNMERHHTGKSLFGTGL